MNEKNQIICGDALEVLQGMPDRSVHCCVTSPPYWGLRNYGVGGQLGLEKTPEEYVERLVEVFREVRRVLRNDGTLWLVLGDSYASSGARNDGNEGYGDGRANRAKRLGGSPVAALKPKDLVGVPWRVAFALQVDGWWLRQDIIWAKSNSMPESVHDRCTKSHEHIFLLAKSARYYYDNEAIKEPAFSADKITRDRDTTKLNNTPGRTRMEGLKTNHYVLRNKRDVWTVSTKPYKEAHFAVYPIDLIRPCILAGSSEKGCCPECGAPWERVIDKKSVNLSNAAKAGTIIAGKGHVSSQVREGHDVRNGPTSVNKTVGWRPTCACDVGDSVPCTILDPFIGSGTTGIVAKQEGRHFIGIGLNPEYIEMARKRINRECPMERLL